MEMNELFNIGASLLENKLGQNKGVLSEALSSILKNKEGGFDLSSITSVLQNGNLGSIISSWIGSGENSPIDASDIKELLGNDKIDKFAKKLGIDRDTAADALKDVLPNIVDKATPKGDDMLANLGGLDGIMKMAGKFF